MNHTSAKRNTGAPIFFYRLLLLAYPLEFRREFGREMLQVFQDCCRRGERTRGRRGIIRVCTSVIFDTLQTAPRERLQNFRKGFNLMKALRTFAVAIIVYIAAIMIFGKVLVYARPYLPYTIGAMIDSLVSIGIAFNFVVLLLVTTKLLSPAGAVRAACIAVVVLLAIVLALLPERPNSIALITMVLSLLFWFGAHRMWAHRRAATAS